MNIAYTSLIESEPAFGFVSELDRLGYEVVLLSEQPNAFLFHIPQKHTLICIIRKVYLPLSEFKNIFEQISVFVVLLKIKKFVFDKRCLTSFHQPSMEWYFIHWKPAMYANGLSVHRKILPAYEWFAKAVMLGKANIIRTHPEHIIDLLDIKYFGSLSESIEL